jgi:hypothetical protein
MPASRILPIGTWIIRQAPGSDVGFTIETFDADRISSLGSQVPLRRAAHPDESARPGLLRQREAVQLLLGRGARADRRETLPGYPGPPRLPSG